MQTSDCQKSSVRHITAQANTSTIDSNRWVTLLEIPSCGCDVEADSLLYNLLDFYSLLGCSMILQVHTRYKLGSTTVGFAENQCRQCER